MEYFLSIAQSSPASSQSYMHSARQYLEGLQSAAAQGAWGLAGNGGDIYAAQLQDTTSLIDEPAEALFSEIFALFDDYEADTNTLVTAVDFAYERDLLGRITAQQQIIMGDEREHQYVYDAAGRLISHTVDGLTTTWGFDDNGNRTMENGAVIATYDSEDRLQSWKGNTYSYNAAGDLQGKTTPTGSASYTYDTLGNLTSVILPNNDQIDYLIDPLNRRIGKRKNGALQYGLLYRDGLRPVAQLDANGRIHAVFIYAEKANVPSAMLRDGNLYRIISDHLGSVRMVIDTGNNAVAQQMDYDVWGKVIADTNPGLQPFGFAGGLYDPDTGLTRFGARDYDAETGRWTAKDPILFAGGDTNLYGYVLQDPVNFIDRNGASPRDVERFRETFNSTVAEMTRNGERMSLYTFNNMFAHNRDDENPYWTPVARAINENFRNGKSTMICGEQWRRVYNNVTPIKTDDKWHFHDVLLPWREYGVATSENPNDPMIILDPWSNNFNEVYFFQDLPMPGDRPPVFH